MPDLNKPREEKVSRPTSILSNFDVPLYEELMGPKEGQPIKRSMSVTPGLLGMKSGEEVRPKNSFKRMLAFQDYMSTGHVTPGSPEIGKLPHPLGQQSHLWYMYLQQGLQ